ncbi:MAG: RNA polymerase sigma factor [Oscillospiraceae bacterium]|nr:RNA polymerase sigma factor [Oscillospiraceae bacterium]
MVFALYKQPVINTPIVGEPVVIDVNKVEAARNGDKDCFAQVYECIAPDLYKVALYTLGNAHDAEDVVSETFIEAYRGIANLRDASSFKAWMMKILSVRCKRKVAEYVKHKNTFDIEGFMTTLSDESDIGTDISEQVTVVDALGRLNSKERQIIALSVLQGYSNKEIAQILGAPQGTVSSKLHRSLVKLRKMLEAAEQQGK